MTPINFHKKEKPLTSLVGMGGGAAGMANAGGAAEKVYMEDVFSTYLYKGNGGTSTITNGIDFAGKGGMVWCKSRGTSENNNLWDTVRGVENNLTSNTNTQQGSIAGVTAFNSNGFTLGSEFQNNQNNITNCSWSFRKSKGFFDIVTWEGNATSGRQLPHNLGCVPGMVIVKQTDGTQDWTVYHRDTGAGSKLKLNTSDATGSTSSWNSVVPTSTYVELGSNEAVNQTGKNYVAYLFAGGASDEAGAARSVEFSGSNELSLADSADWNLGTTFTIEAWIKIDTINNYNCIIAQAVGSGNNWYMSVNQSSNTTNGYMQFYDFDGGETINSAQYSIIYGQWTHVAIVNNAGTAQWYINGIPSGNSGSLNVAGGSLGVSIGSQGGSYKFDGKISNLRLVKGGDGAVYTSAFRPPTAGLTNITDTKLLCCNKNTVTGSTVTPGTISESGSPTSSIDTPFDDPNGFKFGENEDQGVVKCGRYIGNGDADGPEVYLGWEPQWILIKHNSGENWVQFDSMRGVVSDDKDIFLVPNSNASEDYGGWWLDFIDFTSTGFKIKSNYNIVNQNNGEYLFLAIRRPDGLVGKLPEAGTDAFNVVYGNSSSIIPNFPSNFPVDMGIYKQPATAYSWYLHTRLVGPYNLKTDSNAAQAPSPPGDGDAKFDCNAGWGKFGYNTDKASWMWKRYAGFDVVTDKGDGGTTKQIAHGLGVVPEMIWRKNRDNSVDKWQVYHMGLNGGTNPYLYRLYLNDSNAEMPDQWTWTNAPTDTYFTVGANGAVNRNTDDFVTMLFASVDGISSVGSYSPSSSSTTVTCGFQPRFVIVKAMTKDNTWSVADSLRGMTAGNDPALALNENWENDKYGGADWIDVSATGFTVNSTGGVGTADANSNGETYLYYAHA